MTKNIDFYFDFISPYTYIGYKRLELEKETIAKHKERVDAELANQEKLRKETNKALVKQLNNRVLDAFVVSETYDSILVSL